MASVEQLLAQLAAMNYTPPSNYTGYKPQDISVDRTIKNFKPANYSLSMPAEKGKESNDGFKPDLWGMIAGTLGLTGNIASSSIYDTTKDFKDKGFKFAWEDGFKLNQLIDPDYWKFGAKAMLRNSPIGIVKDTVEKGAKGQVEKWTDGKASWGDVPGIGFLDGIADKAKHGTDTMNLLGLDGWKGTVAGIGLDIVSDPLTFLTGGLSTATKAGKAAQLTKMDDIARGMGLTNKFDNVDDLLKAAEDLTRARYAKYPNIVENMVLKKSTEIEKALKAAQATAFNSKINTMSLSLPKLNSTIDLGTLPKWALNYRTEATLGDDFAHVAQEAFKKFGIDDADQARVIEKIIGKNKQFKDLTKTEFNTIYRNLENASGDLKKYIDSFAEVIDANMWKAGKVAPKADDALRLGTNAVSKVDDTVKLGGTTLENARPATKAANTADDLFKSPDITDFITKDVDMANTKMNFERWMDKKNPFNARTLKTGDDYVNSMADHIADANTRRLGEFARSEVELSRIQKALKGFSKSDMEDVIYTIEKSAPINRGGKNFQPSAKVRNVAAMVEDYLKQLGDKEVAEGVLSKLRDSYFPHVMSKNDEAIQAMIDFQKAHPEFGNLVGGKGSSNYDKARKSFKTLSERDDYIYKLEKAISKEKDPDKVRLLTEQRDRVANLFETDVVEALTRRTKEGIRAAATKAMQKELTKFGMMKSYPKGSGASLRSGFIELDPLDAKKMGLDPDKVHMMNESVFDGMKRIDAIFTNQNMNKAVRTMAAIGDLWRPLVTYYKPSHYRNNAIGNFMINTAAGVTLKDYKTSTKLLNKWLYHRDTMTKFEREIIEKAYRHNVIAGGFLFDSKKTWKFTDPTNLEKLADVVGENKAIKAVRKQGENMDDTFRLANFVNGLNKYGDTAKAAEQVRTYLFNYNELTNADRHMRTLVPFWNWTKNNIPLQMKLLLDNPKFAVNVGRFYNLFNENAEVPEGQEYLTEGNNYLNMGNGVYTSMQNPINDLNLLLDPMKGATNSLNPLPQSLLEVWGNKKAFTGKPISYGSDTTKLEDIPEYLLSKTGIGKNVYDLFSSYLKQNDGKGNVIPEDERRAAQAEAWMDFVNPITRVRE